MADNKVTSENKPIENASEDKYDFTNLSFEELFRVPLVEMSFRGEPLAGPDFFNLDFLALQKIPFFLPEENKEQLLDDGDSDEVSDDNFDFLALSFEELMKVPVRANRWQENDTVPEPDLESLSLADLMKLPVRRAFIADLDPDALKKLLGGNGEDFFSDLPSTASGNNSNGGGNLFTVDFGNTSIVTDTSQNSDTNINNQNNQNNGGGFTPPPPESIPVSINDSGFFAIKGFSTAPFSNNTGNLFLNDQPGTGTPIQLNDISFNNGSIPGNISVTQNGNFTYLAPAINNNNPSSPIDYSFSYRSVDVNGSVSNYATVSLKLYDPPVLSINDVKIIEASGTVIALFTVTLTGAIPIPLTIFYSTQNGSAIAGEDYQSTSGNHTFNNLNPSVTSQQFTMAINILDDSITELVQKFFVNLNIAGTFVNAGASDLIGEAAISDTDKLNVNNVIANSSVYEAGLSPGGSNAGNEPIVKEGNLLTNQNFGQIPLSNIDITNFNSVDQTGPAVFDNVNRTWTLTGDYFELIVYREDINGHSKGDYVYTLSNNVQNTNNQDFLQHINFDLTPIDPGSLVNQSSRTGTGELQIKIVDDLVHAVDNTGVFYAIKGGNNSHSQGNLLANDIPGADGPLTISNITYKNSSNLDQTVAVPANGFVSVSPYFGGSLMVYADGSYSYTPPSADNSILPGAPSSITFSYQAQDEDGSSSQANVDIKLYDKPIVYVHPITVTEGTDGCAHVVIELIGQIPTALTLQYSTENGSASNPEGYLSASGGITFSNTGVLSQQISVPVKIIDNVIVESPENFIFNITSGNINFDSSFAQNQATITILDNDFYTLKATNDSVSTNELCLDPNLPVSTASQSGNVLTNDNTGTVPNSSITVKSIEFTVDNLLTTYPTLYENYDTQGAAITTNGTHYTVTFDLPSNNILEISMPDGSVLKMQSNGHYEFYQPQGGISQDTHYDWTYTIKAPNAIPANLGDDKGILSISLTNETVYANNDQLFTKGQLNYDIVLVLDVSGSMSTNVNNLSRLALQKLAAIDIINTYDRLAGDLKITIVPFGSDATGKNTPTNYTGAFTYTSSSLSDAINYINNSVAIGMNNPNGGKLGTGTHYDDALFHTRTYLQNSIAPNSEIEDYAHIVYFMTDGVPTNNRTALSLSPSWQGFINDPDNNISFGGIAGSNVQQIDVIPVTIDVSTNNLITAALNPVGNTNQPSEIVNLDYNGSNIINLSTLYNNLSTQSVVTTNILANDVDTFHNGNSDLTVTQVSYFDTDLNSLLSYDLSPDQTEQVEFQTANGATVTVHIDGTFTYTAGPGFNSPEKITETFYYKTVNDCNIISADGKITTTVYNNNYTLVNLAGNAGNDSLNTNGVYNQGTVVMSGASGNNIFNIDMGASGLKPALIVIQDFNQNGHNTINFINVQDNNNDSIIDKTDVIAKISSVQIDSLYEGANVSFHLQNGTTVLMQNSGPIDPIAPPSSPTALLSFIEESGHLTINIH